VPSNGLSGQGTSGAGAVVAITSAQLAGGTWFNLSLMNVGANPGFLSLDGGITLIYFPGSMTNPLVLTNLRLSLNDEVTIQRASSSDLSDVFVAVF
jgi:hypothetical protein